MPGIELLPGEPTIDVVGGPVCRHLDREKERTWAALSEMTPRDILGLSHMGQKRLDALATNVVRLLGSSVIDDVDAANRQSGRIDVATVAALREIASWALSKGAADDLLTAIDAARSDRAADAPQRAIERLRSVPVTSLADQEIVRRYDPVASAQELIRSFDDRQRRILERIVDLDGSAPTLQALAAEFGVTRQRIAQIEEKVRRTLDEVSGSAEHRTLGAAAELLAERFGTAIPLRDVKADFAGFPPDLVDRLLLFLAGPYRLRNDWILSESLEGDLDAAVLAIFDTIAERGWAPAELLDDALGDAGVRAEHRAAVLRAVPKLRRVGEVVVDWRGGLLDKALRLLELRGEPMTKDELCELIQPNSEASLTGQLANSARIRRVGLRRFALSEWDIEEYRGIVYAMFRRIASAGAPVDLVPLADSIHEDYGASPNSVKILAGTHPAFLLESDKVRLRTPDQPYRPSQQLRETPRCYLVDGSWVWRYPVDHDVLRGSGRALPESVAVHLAVMPASKRVLRGPFGDLVVSWWHQPVIGSTRAAARQLEAEEGDQLFLVCRSNSDVEFRLLRREDLSDDPAERLLQLMGLPPSEEVDDAVASALAMSASDGPTMAVRDALLRRKEQELVELLDQADEQRGGGGEAAALAAATSSAL